MNKYLAFAEAHPALMTLVILPIATAIFNGITRPRTPEEYDDMWPPFAKFCKLMRAFGPVPQKIVEALKADMSARAKRISIAPPPVVITEKKE